MRKFNIAFVCDFFYPGVGGVESHIYQLSLHLKKLGHNVTIVTHQVVNNERTRSGVRYLKGNIKVYYLPIQPVYNNTILITYFGTFSVMRQIFIRESIEIVHGHSAFSPIAQEALTCASTMGLKTVFTDHSLFGFADLSSILANKALQFGLSHVDKIICVSFTSKENTVLRANLDPNDVYVIPNAIDSDMFKPDLSKVSKETVNIVVLSRLVYRKGVDLLCLIIPPLCHEFPFLRFTIGGDGPKYLELEEIRERYKLQDQIKLLGSIQQDKARDVLIQGDIFLNTSLTEAFCIAIVEAASCGLEVVSTKVGGIVEVLPEDLIDLVPVSASELASRLATVVERVRKSKSLLSQEQRSQAAMKKHEQIKQFYNWNDVAKRTEVVYEETYLKDVLSYRERMRIYLNLGSVSGKLACILWNLLYFFYHILCLLRPAHDILPLKEVKYRSI